MFRNLLAVAQKKTCPLSRVTVGCEIIYTFVVGGKTEGRTFIRLPNVSSSDFFSQTKTLREIIVLCREVLRKTESMATLPTLT